MTGTPAAAAMGPVTEGHHRMPVLLSVNVGMPKNVSWQGETVYTGIWKRPVRGPAMVRRLNIDGLPDDEVCVGDRYSPAPLEPSADGEALICCARPRTGIVLDM